LILCDSHYGKPELACQRVVQQANHMWYVKTVQHSWTRPATYCIPFE